MYLICFKNTWIDHVIIICFTILQKNHYTVIKNMKWYTVLFAITVLFPFFCCLFSFERDVPSVLLGSSSSFNDQIIQNIYHCTHTQWEKPSQNYDCPCVSFTVWGAWCSSLTAWVLGWKEFSHMSRINMTHKNKCGSGGVF